MGEGLKRVAKQCGGLIAKSGDVTAQFDGDGNAINPAFIYAVDEDCFRGRSAVASSEILKETAKQVVIKDCIRAFDYRTTRNKADYPVYRTPAEAIDGYVATKLREIATKEQQLEGLRRQIERAEALREGGTS